jgi:hypothetical protein
MKFIVALVLTSILSFAAGLYAPWWWAFAIVAFLVALLVHQKTLKAFLSGFLGLFILWGVLALWIDIKNKGLLSAKIATLLPLGGSGYVLILVTALIGGLIAGLAAICGSALRSSNTVS